MGVRVGAGDCVVVGARVGDGLGVGVMDGLAIVVGAGVGDVVGAGVGNGVSVGVADGVGAGAVAVGRAGGVGVGGWRSDSRMIVKVGVGWGVMGVVGWAIGAGVWMVGVGAPPQASRASVAISSRTLARAWWAAARICGLGGYFYEGRESVLGGDFADDGAGLDAGVG